MFKVAYWEANDPTNFGGGNADTDEAAVYLALSNLKEGDNGSISPNDYYAPYRITNIQVYNDRYGNYPISWFEISAVVPFYTLADVVEVK